jgi:hypothetical protein
MERMTHEGINMKLLKEDKWDAWWNSLSPHTQQYLKNQPIWHDADLYKALGVGMLVGFLIGLLF